MKAKVALHNLGCKVNSYETQAMQKMLTEAGYTILPFGDEVADVYIINTCSVTNMADRKSRQMIHKARKMNPDAIVVATGCYVESARKQENVDEDIDVIMGNHEKSKLLKLLDSYFAGEREVKASQVDMLTVRAYDEMVIDQPLEHTRAYVKVQDGCNRFCSYCIIPYVRGRIRSRKVEDVLSEIRRLSAHGVKEVVLTGIHLSSYGLEPGGEGVSLIELIEQVNKIEGIMRIRLGSLEPRIVTEEFVNRLVQCKKVCPHFHLSLQSGCDGVLARMNRQYTTAEYDKGVALLRDAYENPAITTDVIVGFPGETEEEFEITRAYLERIRFYELHVFKYSRRKGTVADTMKGQLTDREKSLRSDVLLSMDERLSRQYRESYVGRKVSVLIEEEEIFDKEVYYTGYTDTYVRVAVKKDTHNWQANELHDVVIQEVLPQGVVLGVAENGFLY